MDRPEMKKLVYRHLAGYLLALPVGWYGEPPRGLRVLNTTAQEFAERLESFAYRAGGTEAEEARLRSVVLEVIEEFQVRSRNMKEPFAVASKPRRSL